MHLQIHSVLATTAADGTATVYLGPVNGSVRRIQFMLGTCTAMTFTISGATTGVAVLATQTAVSANTSYTLTTTGVGASSSWCEGVPVAGEQLKVVISSGGNALTGTFIAYVEGGS